MKIRRLFLILLCFSPASAFAGGSEGGGGGIWQKTLANKNLAFSAPRIGFGGSFVSVLDVCVAGDTLYTIHKQPVYQYPDAPRDSDPVQVGTAILSTPRVFQGTATGEHDFEYPVTYIHGLDYNVDILDATATPRDGDLPVLDTKPFTIPNCPNK